MMMMMMMMTMMMMMMMTMPMTATVTVTVRVMVMVMMMMMTTVTVTVTVTVRVMMVMMMMMTMKCAVWRTSLATLHAPGMTQDSPWDKFKSITLSRRLAFGRSTPKPPYNLNVSWLAILVVFPSDQGMGPIWINHVRNCPDLFHGCLDFLGVYHRFSPRFQNFNHFYPSLSLEISTFFSQCLGGSCSENLLNGTFIGTP